VNPETIPVSKLVEEVGRRIDRRLAAQGKLALWLRVGDHATAEESATADAVKRALQTKPGIVFSKQTVAGAVPVPSGTPGGHVHMRIYAFEPHPDLVLDIGELDGSVCVAAREAGRDPMAPAQSWIWILRAQ
jgi:hypothetical protein